MKQYPKAIVGGIIYNEKNEILLFRSPKWRGWVNPGGHIEWGEKMEEALRREIKEETNLEVGKVKMLAVKEGVSKKDGEVVRHFIFIDYACEYIGGEIITNEELWDHAWYGEDTIFELDLMTEMREVVEIFYQNRR